MQVSNGEQLASLSDLRDQMMKDEKPNNTSSVKKLKPGEAFKLSKEDQIQIGLDMIPMFQAKEEELTSKHKKLKELKSELVEYMDEHGIKLRYVQP